LSATLSFRWLGVAGIELMLGEHILLIDPFLTRPPLHYLRFGRPVPDAPRIVRHVPRCDYILVSHAHYDHLMDVPVLLRQNPQAIACGSLNACRLLEVAGIPEHQRRVIEAHELLTLSPFEVRVLRGRHVSLPPGFRLAGRLPDKLRYPLRLSDYRMDECFAFYLEAGGCRLLYGEAPQPADVLFTAPLRLSAEILRVICPRLIIPIHWDRFFHPLDKPIRPLPGLPRYTNSLEKFRQMAETTLPGVRVWLPHLFEHYELPVLLLRIDVP
jgi:L-ascorbate metabolism protein UlaG (beta-lactamase superfamily)